MQRCILATVLLVSSLLFAMGAAHAGGGAWQPARGHVQRALWPGAVPDAAATSVKAEVSGPVDKAFIAGRPWTYVAEVSRPTLTLYRPTATKAAAAVVVFPGGGYNVLAIDLEGTEACDWLLSRGIACVLLKYRVPCRKTGPYRNCLVALQDAQRAVGLVRFHAAEWGIDPRRIGVMGFSAGGHMVAAMSTQYATRLYPRVDAADDVSCRPDFAIALYPGHLAVRERKFALNPDITVTARTPPTFLLHARDDPVDPVQNTQVYAAALRTAGVPVRMHVFDTGGHAFGLRRTTAPITAWPALLQQWLGEIGVLAAPRE